MRWDYVFYVVGVLLLGAFLYILFDRTSVQDLMGGLLIYSAIVFVLALFGATSFIFGYSLRPKKH